MSAEVSENRQGQLSDDRDDLQLRARIDHSLRLPLLFFFVSGTAWLLLAAALGFLSSVALILPDLFAGWPVLQYGRLQPAFLNAFVYGWAIQVSFGTGYWLIARLGRTTLRSPARLLAGWFLWNTTICLGVLSVLLGWGTSMEWLDFPRAFWIVVLISYLLIMTDLVGMFAIRRNGREFISQWYILAAAFWFPWAYATANGFIHADGGAAVVKTAINGWYVSNLIYMVLTPAALASAYYLASKTTARPVFSQDLARLGFWTLVLFTGWTGVSRYMGGPLPAWIPSVSGAAAVFLGIPAFVAVTNFFKTIQGKWGWISFSPALRFTAFAMLALLVAVGLGAMLAVIPTGKHLQFTFARTSYDLLALYGFFSMAMFGALYFIVPRLAGCEWPNAGMIRSHFWLSVYGIVTMVVFTFVAGWVQGSLQGQWDKEFLTSVERSRPYLAALPIGWSLVLIGNLLFFFQLGLMVLRQGRLSGEGPTLIHKRPEDYFSDPQVVEEGANA